MEIQRIGIIGVGLMGAGIAEVCARTGYDTLVREINDEFLAKGLERIEASMQTAVNHGKLTPADLMQHAAGCGARRGWKTSPIATRRQVCAGHAVHRWRAGNRGDIRGHVSPLASPQPLTRDEVRV
jgi:hypothetical protein